MARIGNPRMRGPKGTVKRGEIVAIQSLISHPMESGLRTDTQTGSTIPPHYIQRVIVEFDGQTVLTADWTTAVSTDPFFSYHIRAETTGPVTMTWPDNKGATFTASLALTVA